MLCDALARIFAADLMVRTGTYITRGKTMSIHVDKLSRMAPPQGLPFNIGKRYHPLGITPDME
jgi:hypothetical protein